MNRMKKTANGDLKNRPLKDLLKALKAQPKGAEDFRLSKEHEYFVICTKFTITTLDRIPDLKICRQCLCL